MHLTHGQHTAAVLRHRPMTAPPEDSLDELAEAIARDYVAEWDADQRSATAQVGYLEEADEEQLSEYCTLIAGEINGDEAFAGQLAAAATRRILRRCQREVTGDLLTVDEVAARLGVSERHVRWLAKRVNRQRVRVAAEAGEVARTIRQAGGGGVWLFGPEDIAALEEHRRQKRVGRPPSKPRGEVMKAHWIQVRIDRGELVADTEDNTDLYLTEILEWYSPDGQAWERQPDCYAIYTGGTKDPIGQYGPTRTWTLKEVLAQHDEGRPGLDIDRYADLQVEVVKWSVDSAGIRREFAAGTEPDDDEYLEFAEQAEA
jgi:AraC-like DNA-binding protein